MDRWWATPNAKPEQLFEPDWNANKAANCKLKSLPTIARPAAESPVRGSKHTVLPRIG